MSRFFEKLKDVKPRDILHIFLFIFALPIALVYKIFRKDLWLVCDNGVEATDNGFCFLNMCAKITPSRTAFMRCIKTALITKMSKNRQNRKVRQFCPLDFISYRKGKHQFSKGRKAELCRMLSA